MSSEGGDTRYLLRHAPGRRDVEQLAIERVQAAVRRIGEPDRLFQHRIEYWRKAAGRRVDNLQHLGGCCLLFQSLVLLGDQPRVFNRDHGLRGEGLQQHDFIG